MNYEMILAVDPGGTTGWAEWHSCDVHYSGQVRGRREFMGEAVEKLERAEARGDRVLVVMEAFTITARTLQVTREYDALYIIGALEDRCAGYDKVDFAALQKPSDAKNFCSDDRLKRAGMWLPTKGGHANDASRHLFLQMAKLGLINPTEVDRRAIR